MALEPGAAGYPAAAGSAGKPAPAAAAGPSLKVVTQRVVSGRLLQDAAAERWASFGAGLVFHVSFTKGATVEPSADGDGEAASGPLRLNPALNLRQVCRSLLTAGLATDPRGTGWQADHSDTTSVVELLKQGVEQSLVIVPQASLVAKLIAGDKYLKYHDQGQKAVAEQLYREFLRTLRETCIELLGKPKSKEGHDQAAGSEWAEKQKAKAGLLTVPPERLFIDGEEWKPEGFSKFNEEGFPLLDASGEEIAKSRRKKLEKALQLYQKKWEKQGGAPPEPTEAEREAQRQAEEAAAALAAGEAARKAAEAAAETSSRLEEPLRLDFEGIEAADERTVFPQLVAGTFGGRQGFEMVSSGPFTHALNF